MKIIKCLLCGDIIRLEEREIWEMKSISDLGPYICNKCECKEVTSKAEELLLAIGGAKITK